MPTRSGTKITLRTVNASEPAGEPYILSDSDLPGFGLRVLPAGGKHYILRYRSEGQRRLYTIGRHGAPWTPESARKEAVRLLGLIASGLDPQAEKERQKQEGTAARAHTVRSVADDFIEQYAKVRKRTWREDRRIFDKYVIPVWGDRPVKSITRADVDDLLQEMAKRGAAVMANRTLACIRKWFNWMLDKPRYDLQASPVVRIEAPGHEKNRTRFLSDDEIVALWKGCDELGYPFGPFTQLLMLTVSRREMVASMRRPDLNPDKKLWMIPAEVMKSGRPHVVPLSDLALEIINAVPAIEGTDFVFPAQRARVKSKGPAGNRHFSGFSKAKAKLDTLSGVTGWRFHDLRRTAVTHLGELRVPRHIRQLLLDHAENDATSIYDRFEYLPERREALDAWADKITRLLNPPGDNVVPLRA